MARKSRTDARGDMLQGTLDMLILRTLLSGPSHGHTIAHVIEKASDEILQVEHGSLYPALHRLEARGWLKAEWNTTDTGRAAKYYSVTKAGRQQLEAETAGWKRLCEAISLVLETSE